MMSITGNNKAVFAKIRNLNNAFQEGIRKGLQQSGVDIAGMKGRTNDGLIKREMNGPKTGRWYTAVVGRKGRVLKRGRAHRASAANESPAVITGELRDSVYFRVQGSGQLRIGANTPYARVLENGGTHTSSGITKLKEIPSGTTTRIAARNYLKRPIAQSRQNIIQNIEMAINNKLK